MSTADFPLLKIMNSASMLLNSSLIKVAKNGALNEVDYLLKKQSDINARNENGVTALMEAVANTKIDVMHLQ